jgi:hypothetical protein
MNPDNQPQNTDSVKGQNLPWYKQFWPWFIIALPASAVIASFISLWLAVSNPETLVVTENEYRQLKSELKAQVPVKQNKATEVDEPDSKSN